MNFGTPKHLTFQIMPKIQAYTLGQTEVSRVKVHRVDIHMVSSHEDILRVGVLRSKIREFCFERGEYANNIYLGKDIYLSVFKYNYWTTNGGLSFDEFEGIKITLLADVNPNYIEVESYSNQDKLMNMC